MLPRRQGPSLGSRLSYTRSRWYRVVMPADAPIPNDAASPARTRRELAASQARTWRVIAASVARLSRLPAANPARTRREPAASGEKPRHRLNFLNIRVLAAALLLGFSPAVTAKPALLTWPDLTARAREKADATIAYGPDQMQRIDVWLPKGPGPHPVVLMVHGGCWQTSIADRTLMDWAAADLRSAGVAVWNIDYRGVDRAGGGFPGTFADAAKAADLLFEKAGDNHLDPGRVVALGHSAGGHLALWLAGRHRLHSSHILYRPTPLPLKAVISLGGLPDLEATEASPDNGCGTEVVAKLVGTGPDRFAYTSVPNLLPLGVPQHLVNGREDRIIPFRMATDYVAKAKAAGDQVTLHTVPETGHVELITPGTPAWTETRRLVLAYFVTPALSRGPASSSAGQGSGTPAQGRGEAK
jgi:acetyl esterase/lipase